MKSRLSSRSTTPLIEIIIVLFFFAFVCTVLLQMFLLSDEKSKLSENLIKADLVATTILEQQKGTSIAEGKQAYYYDRDWKLCGKDDAAFTAEVRVSVEKTSAGTLFSGTVAVYELRRDILEQLISLPFGDYRPA